MRPSASPSTPDPDLTMLPVASRNRGLYRIVARLAFLAPLAALAPLPARAQAPDTTGLGAAVARARESLAGMPALWGIALDDVDWIFAHRGGDFRTQRLPGGGDRIVAVTIPAGSMRANMSFPFEGRRHAMVLLPLPASDLARTRLLVHEAAHTLQPGHLPHPGRTEPANEGADLLDRAEGRAWLFLELRALARALRDSGEARRTAARDALRFRAQRDAAAHPAERARLDALDLAEAIPEYTGWRLAGSTAAQVAEYAEGAGTRRVSWVRGVGYATGPAYGFVIDALAGDGWQARWRTGARLPDLLAQALGDASADVASGDAPVAGRSRETVGPEADARSRARAYAGDSLLGAERERDLARARRLDSLTTRFVTGPVLRLVPGALQVTFDPNGQVPVGTHGTVMSAFRWAAADGAELVAPAGALVPPDWSYIQVSLGTVALPEGALAAPRSVEGDGWRLTLPAGWRVSRNGTRVEVRPPAAP